MNVPKPTRRENLMDSNPIQNYFQHIVVFIIGQKIKPLFLFFLHLASLSVPIINHTVHRFDWLGTDAKLRYFTVAASGFYLRGSCVSSFRAVRSVMWLGCRWMV